MNIEVIIEKINTSPKVWNRYLKQVGLENDQDVTEIIINCGSDDISVGKPISCMY